LNNLNEVLALLELQLRLVGVIALDEDQSTKLIQFIRTMQAAMEQQDEVIRRFKEIYKLELLPPDGVGV